MTAGRLVPLVAITAPGGGTLAIVCTPPEATGGTGAASRYAAGNAAGAAVGRPIAAPGVRWEAARITGGRSTGLQTGCWPLALASAPSQPTTVPTTAPRLN